MKIKLKVIPSSSKNCTAGWLEDTLKIKVQAPPEKGKANKAVIKLLEKTLELKKGSVTLVSGLTSCQKIVEISDIDGDIINQQLEKL
jgi:hypothetical protein